MPTAGSRPGPITDAQVVDAVRDLAWTTDRADGGVQADPGGALRAPEDDRAGAPHRLPDASAGAVDRAMRTLGLSGVRRDKDVRTTIPAKDGNRAGDLLDRDFTAPAPNRVWVTDFTYVRTWSPAWVYVAFIVDVFSQRIVAWHAATSKADRPGHDPAADGDVATRPRRPPRRRRAS